MKDDTKYTIYSLLVGLVIGAAAFPLLHLIIKAIVNE